MVKLKTRARTYHPSKDRLNRLRDKCGNTDCLHENPCKDCNVFKESVREFGYVKGYPLIWLE